MIDGCAELIRILWTKISTYLTIHVLCMLVLYKLPEDDLKKFEICWSFIGIYESVYVNTCAFVDFTY